MAFVPQRCGAPHDESPRVSNAMGSKKREHSVAHLHRYRSVTMALMSASARVYPVSFPDPRCEVQLLEAILPHPARTRTAARPGTATRASTNLVAVGDRLRVTIHNSKHTPSIPECEKRLERGPPHSSPRASPRASPSTSPSGARSLVSSRRSKRSSGDSRATVKAEELNQ